MRYSTLLSGAVGGSLELRKHIARLHGADPENVLVTVGAAEANSITVSSLLQPGDHTVVMEPCYRQVTSLAVGVLTQLQH